MVKIKFGNVLWLFRPINTAEQPTKPPSATLIGCCSIVQNAYLRTLHFSCILLADIRRYRVAGISLASRDQPLAFSIGYGRFCV